jgi:predicted molibdopterin-dependent oxidoreductase YjgC
LLGTEINADHGVTGFLVNNARIMKKVPVILVTSKEKNSMVRKVDEVLKVRSYYYFIKAVNHYLLTAGLENGLFLHGRVKGFADYKNSLLSDDFETLVHQAGVESKEAIIEFANAYNDAMNAILLFSEKEVSSAASIELFNLAMITGKLGKTSNGLVSLKEKNNSQGLFDMGIQGNADLTGLINHGKIRNLFIFGEDPIGCTGDKAGVNKIFEKTGFLMVQDYFMTETAANADLILPASFPVETGGSFTNSQKVIQQFEAALPGKVDMSNIEQLLGLLKIFGVNGQADKEDILHEIFASLKINDLPETEIAKNSMTLNFTVGDDNNRIFNFGCDSVVSYFEKDFVKAIS